MEKKPHRSFKLVLKSEIKNKGKKKNKGISAWPMDIDSRGFGGMC